MPPFKKPKIEIFEDETTGVRKARIGQKEFPAIAFASGSKMEFKSSENDGLTTLLIDGKPVADGFACQINGEIYFVSINDLAGQTEEKRSETFKSLSLYSKEMAKEQVKKEASQNLDTDKLLQEIEELAGEGKSASVPKLEEIESAGSVKDLTKQSDLEAQLLEVRQKYQKEKEEKEELLTKYNTLQTEHNKLKTEYDTVVVEKEQLSEGARRAVEVAKIAKTKADKLETDYKNLENENKGLKDKYKQLEDQNKNLENQLAILEEKHKELGTEYNSLKQQHEAEKQQFEGKVKELEDKIKDLEVQIVEKDTLIEKKEIDYNELKDKYTQLEDRNKNLENQLKEKTTEYNKKLEEARDLLTKIGGESTQKEKELNETKKELEKLQKEIAELRKERDDLKAKYEEVQPLEPIKKKVEEISKEYNSLETLKSNVAEYEANINSLREILTKLSKLPEDVKEFVSEMYSAKINEGYEKIKTLHSSLGLAGEPKLEDFGNESYVNELLNQLNAKKAKLEKDCEDTKNILVSTIIMQFIPQQSLAQSGELEKKVQQPGTGTVAPTTPTTPAPRPQENLEKKVQPPEAGTGIPTTTPTQPGQTSQYQSTQQPTKQPQPQEITKTLETVAETKTPQQPQAQAPTSTQEISSISDYTVKLGRGAVFTPYFVVRNEISGKEYKIPIGKSGELRLPQDVVPEVGAAIKYFAEKNKSDVTKYVQSFYGKKVELKLS